MPVAIIHLGEREIRIPFEGTPLLGKWLAEHGLGVAQPCGGRGVCGKCAVHVTGSLRLGPGAVPGPRQLACQTYMTGDCQVILPEAPADVRIETEGIGPACAVLSRRHGYGAAVDIGTTTVVLKLLSLETGETLSTRSALNPQVQAAADVIGRIAAACDGRGPWLESSIQGCVEQLLHAACQAAGVSLEEVSTCVVAGNTTMLYLLTGRNPVCLSCAPFRADTLFGAWHTLWGRAAYLPRCMDAFVGADITCAVLASGMCQREETALLMDIGTNGEIALWHGGELYVTSTAAGPAFEGAGISCGCGSIAGAIDGVWVEKGQLCASTVDHAPAVGICGSGIVDAVAALLSLNLIDETGAMETKSVEIYGGIALTDQDIRNVQLSKGAIAAGVRTMLDTLGIHEEQVSKLYIAGGFGSHLRLESAARIGLIAPAWVNRAEILGNAALAGATQILLRPQEREQAEKLAAKAKTVALGGNPLFAQHYMECMLFA